MQTNQPARTVIHVINCLRIGGTETQLVEQLRSVDRRRWRPVVTCLEHVGELIPDLQALDCDPHEFSLQGTFKKPNTVLQAIRLARLIRSENASVVHAHDFYANLLAIAAARLAGRPVIVSQRDQGRHLRPLQRRGQALARRLATRVLTNAPTVAFQIASEGTSLDKIRVVPNGIDLSKFDRQSEGDPALPPWNGLSAAVVANLHSPQKGHLELLAAASELPGVRFLLCGDGEIRPALEREAARRGIAERVLFLGKRTDVPAILRRCDLLCHPSHAEGFPNAVLEGMAARLPVVASRVGGIPDLAIDGDNAILVPPQDAAALQGALSRLIGDATARARMGRAGRARVERSFTSQRMAEKVSALYDEIVSGQIGEQLAPLSALDEGSFFAVRQERP